MLRLLPFSIAAYLLGIENSRQIVTHLRKLRQLLPEQVTGEVLVYGGDTQHVRHHVRVTYPRAFVKVLEVESELIEACG